MSRRLNIGEQLGDYRIVGFLGAGGMGSVYHGVHTKIERPAAIKLLSNVAENTTFKERFFNEARVQAGLHHPNIATLYDFQENGDLLYIVMEYVDGETLEALVSRKYFAVEDALKTFESVCDAIAFIHGNDIVHRDIKPQNIKLASNGKVKLLDFGIAKDSASQGLTRIGGVIGTPNYLAPEQLMGGSATQISDIWALGVLLYEMLTGVGPFKGTTLEQLQAQITTAKFEEPEKINPAVPAEVSNIVAKCLAVDSKMRYQSVNLLLADVRDAQRRYQPQPVSKKGLFFYRPASDPSPQPAGVGSDGESSATRFLFIPIAAIAASILVLFVLLGLAIWAISGPGTAGTNSGNSRAGSQSGPANSNADVPKNTRVGAQSAPQPVVNHDRPRATIDVTEGTAEVYRDDQFIGKTPLMIEGAENEKVNLTLKRVGYDDHNEVVEITTRRKVFTFSLRRAK